MAQINKTVSTVRVSTRGIQGLQNPLFYNRFPEDSRNPVVYTDDSILILRHSGWYEVIKHKSHKCQRMERSKKVI
jgi:hypothetical protein